MKKLIPLVAACLVASAAWAADLSNSAILQLRWVLDAPSAESEPMSLVSGNRKEVMNVQKAVQFDQTSLKSAKAHADKGYSRIEIIFTEEGQKRFAEVTRLNVGRRLAIVLDGQLYCAPVINAAIPGGKAEITGDFGEPKARELAAKITEAIKKR